MPSRRTGCSCAWVYSAVKLEDKSEIVDWIFAIEQFAALGPYVPIGTVRYELITAARVKAARSCQASLKSIARAQLVYRLVADDGEIIWTTPTKDFDICHLMLCT